MLLKLVLRKATALGVAFAVFASLILAACGGGSGTSGGGTPANITGRFVDATVVGIAYKCGTSTAVAGLTNANGEYTCPSGQAVAFYVGDILIGQVSSPLAVITPLDMVGAGASPSHTTVANIVRFLMSISSTDPATGTITIDPAVMTAAAGQTTDFTAASATALDSLIPTLKPGATIYTSAQATAHVSASINGLFAGNYAGTYTGSSSGGWTVTIAADGTVSGQADGATVSGTMATTLSTGSTYGFSGTAGGTPWVGTLNISSKVFSGTWDNNAGSSGTWTGTVDNTPPATTPTVTGFSPTSGAVGTSVTITGTNLGSFIPAPIVKFGTTVATPTYAGSTSITVAVPAGLAAGNSAITLSNLNGTGVVTVGTFNVTAAGGGTTLVAPIVAAGTKFGGAVMGPLTLAGTVTSATLSSALTLPALKTALTTDGTNLYVYGDSPALGISGILKIDKATGAVSLLTTTSGTFSALTSDGINIFAASYGPLGGVGFGGIYQITPAGTVTLLVPNSALNYSASTGLAVVGNNLYFTTAKNIKKFDLTTSAVTTHSFGNNACTTGLVCDGVGTNTTPAASGATLGSILGAMTTDGTYLYVLEASQANPGIVRQVSIADGSVKTIGGTAGLTQMSSWLMGTGLTTDGAGNVYVVNQATSQIIKYGIASGTSSVVATGNAAGTSCATNTVPVCTGLNGGVTSDGTNLFTVNGSALVKIQ